MLKNRKKNEIVQKALKPYLTRFKTGTAICLIAIVLLTVIVNEDTYKQQNGKKKSIAQTATIIITFGMINLLAALSVRHLSNNVNKSAAQSLLNYIEKLIEKDPEMHCFINVLDYPDSVQRITDLVSNKLPRGEQNKIADILVSLNDYDSQETTEKAYDKIITIIENYAKNHQEDFVDEIWVALEKESFALHVNQNIVNAASLSGEKIKN